MNEMKNVVQQNGTILKKYEVIALNNVLSGVKIGKVSKDAAFALLDVKIELSRHVKEIEDAQKIAAEDLKPEQLKKEGAEDSKDEATSALKKRWNDKYMEFVGRRMEEEVEVKLKTIAKDDIYELSTDNGLNIQQIEILMRLAK